MLSEDPEVRRFIRIFIGNGTAVHQIEPELTAFFSQLSDDIDRDP